MVGCLTFPAMMPIQKSCMKNIWQRYLQQTATNNDGWRPASAETVNRTMSALVHAERHQSRWHFRDRDSAIWQHQGNNCCHTYKHLWGCNKCSCRACVCPSWDDQGEKPWCSCNNIDRVKLKKHQEVTFQESGLWATAAHAHTYIIACLTQAYPSSLTLCTEGVCQGQIHECLTNNKRYLSGPAFRKLSFFFFF